MTFFRTCIQLGGLFLFCLFGKILFAQDQDSIPASYLNNWQTFHEKGDYEAAIEQAQNVFELGKEIDNPRVMANALFWQSQSELAKPSKVKANRRVAERHLKEALDLVQRFDDTQLEYSIVALLRQIATDDNDQTSLAIFEERLAALASQAAALNSNQTLAEELELLDEQKMELQGLLDSLNEDQMKNALLLARQKNMLDSLKMVRMEETFLLEKKEMTLKEQKSQLELQENQLRLSASQRNLFFALAAILALLAVGVFLRFTNTKKYNAVLEGKNQDLKLEREKSDSLLLNILPATVAEELKNTGVAQARRYEKATVMFSDFKNFSQFAKSMPPELLVEELDLYFKAFDEIITQYNLEKIKTIGDAYLCVGGVPQKPGYQPQNVIRAALEIQDLLAEMKATRLAQGKPYFEARIGIHTGPLVAGVVGSKKFAYDIWGDTVNIASRMESNGEVWKVNVSISTYELVKDAFKFEYRGVLPIKNRGEVAMYFVEERERKA